MSRITIGRGIHDLQERGAAQIESPRRVRQPGAGRPTKLSEEPELLGGLESLVEPETCGDPQSPLRWTLKSLRVLATELSEFCYTVSYRTVGTLLKKPGYSLQANAKKLEGARHVDRDTQFRHVARQSKKRIKAGEPVLSVDTKKKEPLKTGVKSTARRVSRSR